MEPGGWQPLQVTEEVVTQVEFDVARRADYDPPHQEAADASHRGETDQHGGVGEESGEGVRADGHILRQLRIQMVDAEFQHPGRQQLQTRGAHEENGAHGKPAAIPEQVREEGGRG